MFERESTQESAPPPSCSLPTNGNVYEKEQCFCAIAYIMDPV